MNEFAELLKKGKKAKQIRKEAPDLYLNALKTSKDKKVDEFLNTLVNSGVDKKQAKKILKDARKSGYLDASKKELKTAIKQADLSNAFDKASTSMKEMDKSGKFTNTKKSFSELGNSIHGKFSNGLDKVKTKLSSLKVVAKDTLSGFQQTISDNLPAVLLAAGTAAAAGVNALANNIRSRALNAGTKNLNKYNKKINKSQSKLDSVNDIKAEFNRLAKGVDNTTNQNVGLSTSDYSRYLELKKQLVKTNKDLVKSMDSEGNAIIDNNSAIDKSIKKYERQIQKNKQAIVSKKNLAIQNKAAALNMNKATEGYQVGDRSLAGNVGYLIWW